MNLMPTFRRYAIGFALLAFVLGKTAAYAAGAAESSPTPPDEFAIRAALFAYDPGAPLAMHEISVERGDGFVRCEITFAGDPRGAQPTTVSATLIEPEGRQHCAAILWVHWLGDPATTNRTQFRAEAEALAARGVVSLLVDTMWAKPKWYPQRVLEEDFANSIRQVIELRRALDLLIARPEVDAMRVALVGHDYGAMHGLIAAALDARVRTAVFIAATPSFHDWAFFAKKPASMDDYLKQNAPLDLLAYAPRLAGRPVFMQFAREDEYVPIPQAEAFFAALREPRRLQIYDGAHHDMAAPPAIREERTAWLVRELALHEN